MTNITRKVITGLTTGALLLSLSSSFAFADTTLTISGNGQKSDNTVTVTNTSSTTVQQTNTANVTNNVTNNSNTGGNKASDNVGQNGSGGVTIHTGSTSSDTTVQNALNSNSAQVNSCGCQAGSTSVSITGNGQKSDNTANLTQGNTVSVGQSNSANVTNTVNNNSNTGYNHANDNIGGTVDVHTGDVSQTTKVNTFANSNQVMVGGGTGSTDGTGVMLTITGNLEKSDNNINVTDTTLTSATQTNAANVTNDVNNNANTGKNGADDNLGSVMIHTGSVDANTEVDNEVNFNAADISSCGCATGVTAKIGGNGQKTDNNLKGTLGDTTGVGQGNAQNLTNTVGGENGANTGDNKANDNGGANIDPTISTGDVTGQGTTVSNSGGVNTYGPGTFVLPGNTQVNFSWGFLNGLWSQMI